MQIIMRFAVTGATGFIGRNFTKELLRRGHSVTIVGCIKSYKIKGVESIRDKIEVLDVSLEDLELLKSKLANFDVIAHFAASASTKEGLERTDVDLKKGVLLTYNILEAMRLNNIKRIIFSSGPAVYGYPIQIPTSEETGMLLPVSLYGAAKLASEGLISAFCHLFKMKGWIYRLGNVVGPDIDRGVLRDFTTKLKENPSVLQMFGNGNQKKDVIYIDDCVGGILYLFEKTKDVINLFNLSSGTTITVNRIAEIVREEMNLRDAKIIHSSKDSIGWLGDVPVINFDISKIKDLGWKPKYNSEEAIRFAVRGMIDTN